ncbi:MAG: rod shape-determining protein [Planctomycetales bacterium]|nr:rod shape-determining protein [Planctomycetales bacterium]
MLNRLRQWMCPDLAIDLGTANTLIAVQGSGIVLDEPSVVALEKGSRRILGRGTAVGKLARQMMGRTPDSITAVRPLKDGVIQDFELCEAMLHYFIRKASPQRRGLRPRIVIAVPGGITPVEKRAVFNSAERAGAGRIYLVDEARAASIGAGLPISEPMASMVCDIGGGTTEVAILSLGEIISSQSIRVGGDAMDQAIVGYLRRHYSLRVGLATAENLRLEIGSAHPIESETTAEVSGADVVSGLPRKATITSEEVREALAESLEAIVDAVRGTLDTTGPDLAADLVQQGLVLAGGGALLPGLDRFLAEHTGLPVRLAGDPLTAVATGAQICLEHFNNWRSSLHSSDDDPWNRFDA